MYFAFIGVQLSIYQIKPHTLRLYTSFSHEHIVCFKNLGNLSTLLATADPSRMSDTCPRFIPDVVDNIKCRSAVLDKQQIQNRGSSKVQFHIRNSASRESINDLILPSHYEYYSMHERALFFYE